LAGLYAAIANGGKFRQLQYTGKASSTTEKTLMSEEAAFMIHETLSKINRPDFPLNWTATERMPKIAWKTGTSYGRRDAWSIGYNKKYTIAVWVGNFSGVGAPDLSGANIATPLLFRLFNTIDYDSDEGWFSQPEECKLRKVCSETGLVPGPDCENHVTDYFIPLVSSTQLCQRRQDIKIDASERISYCMQCAPS